MDYLINALSFVLILGIMIFLHELGHFVVARLFRIRIETFSLGFGKRLWGFERGGVDYRISALPLGGYVKMAGEHLGEPREGAPDEFLSRPRWQRMLVMLAGPAMNFLLAFCLLTANYTIGVEIPVFYRQPARVGFAVEGTPAAKAGLQAGDEIVSLGGQPVKDWADLQMVSISFSRQTVPLVFRRDGQTLTRSVALGETLMDPSEITGILPFIPTLILAVSPGYPAEKIGLRKGDVIETVTAGGKTARGYIEISRLIQQQTGRSLRLHVRRGDQVMDLEAVPVLAREGQKRGVLGFNIDIGTLLEKYGLLEALGRSLQENYNFVVLTCKILGKVVTGHLSFRQFSGPIGIAQASGEAVRTLKITVVFSFMALVSMNLAVLNLLPIPVLDGGMIFLLLIEMAIRRDLPIRLKERAIWVGFVLLVALMGVVIFFDLLKVFG
jgi:regulator of sigma E protease